MKKRILTLALALAVGACDGDKGDPGPAGPAGPPGPGGGAGSGGGTAQVVEQGLVLDVQSATVAEGQAPTVTFRVRDFQGAPVDLKAESTRATAPFRPTFVLSKLEPTGKWNSYLTRTAQGRASATGAPKRATATQATGQGLCTATPCNEADQARLVARGDGVFTYTFPNPVTGVAPGATHRVGIYGSRNFNGVNQPGSATFDFVPAGGAPQQRDVVVDAACNKCHTVVNAHGGSRRGVKLCVTCHSPQTIDPETGNDVDMTAMIHKIHKGRLLANGYTIVGNSQSVHDYSRVAMGPSHSSYFEVAGGGPPEDKGIIRECQLCHSPEAAQSQNIRTALSAQTCASCHDDVNMGQTPLVQNGVTVAPGVGHLAGPIADQACSLCHGAGTPLGVAEVHSPNYATAINTTFPDHSFQLKIDAANGFAAGSATPPSVDFTLTLDGQPFNLRTNFAQIGTLAFQIAGPITDYAETLPAAFGAQSALVSATATTPAGLSPRLTDIDAAAGKFRYTFAPPATPAGATVIPAGRTGVYAVSFEAFFRETRGTISKPYAADPVFRGQNKNVAYVNVADGQPATAERRLIVANAKCNNCHEDLGFHGNRSRQGVDYCATCHNPNLSNAGRARFQVGELVPASSIDGLPAGVDPTANVFVAESVATGVFIHKIHMGAELSRPYRLGANRTASDRTPGADGLADFSQFEAPSPMGNCQTCHEGETYRVADVPHVPVKQAILGCPQQDAAGWCGGPGTGTATIGNAPVLGQLVTPPNKAICGGCHDDAAAGAHMDLNTIRPMTEQAIESCNTCHGAGKDFDAVRMHPPVLAPTVDLPDT